MPYLPPISEGLLSDLVGNLENLVPDLPGPIDDMLKDAVNHAVAVVDPADPTPADAPPPPVGIPDTSQKNDVVKALDTVISAIGVALRFRFLIPDQFEPVLETLAKALVLVRSWVD